MDIQPFYIVSLLVEQPTWGGDYIAKFKNISLPKSKIGQSYELAQDSILLTQPTSKLPYLLATANDISHPQWHGPKAKHLSIQQLIDQNPEQVLGKKVVAKTGPKMTILNKFTQAKENSYQVHVSLGHEFNHWQPKPESWYFFEPGKATLGVKSGVEISKYQHRCQDIYQHSLQISRRIKAKDLTVGEGRKLLADYINQDHPHNYVNTISAPKNSIVDLSQGGIHHSWENDPHLPQGNIVYEVQLDQRDDVSSIRSFDQGKIKENGDVRKIAIDDYFSALNTAEAANKPQQYMKLPQQLEEAGALITHIFNNSNYQLTQIDFSDHYQSHETQLDQQFHHLFTKKGLATITWGDQEWPLATGQSLFIPASCENYRLTTTQETSILKTTA